MKIWRIKEELLSLLDGAAFSWETLDYLMRWGIAKLQAAKEEARDSLLFQF